MDLHRRAAPWKYHHQPGDNVIRNKDHREAGRQRDASGPQDARALGEASREFSVNDVSRSRRYRRKAEMGTHWGHQLQVDITRPRPRLQRRDRGRRAAGAGGRLPRVLCRWPAARVPWPRGSRRTLQRASSCGAGRACSGRLRSLGVAAGCTAP